MQNGSEKYQCPIGETDEDDIVERDVYKRQLQICHSSARIQIEHTEPAENGIQIEGVLHISFLYVKADDTIPFDLSLIHI